VHSGYLGGTWVSIGTEENTFEAKGRFSSLITYKFSSNASVNVNGESVTTNPWIFSTHLPLHNLELSNHVINSLLT